MALTSVVPPFLSRQQPQLSEIQTGPYTQLSTFSNYHTPHMSSATQFNLMSPTDMPPANLVFPNVNTPQSAFFTNGFNSPEAGEPYRLLPHRLSTLVNTGYPMFRSAPNPGTPMSAVSPPCLLPTPSQGTTPETLLQSIGAACVNKSHRFDYNGDLHQIADDNLSVQMANSNSEASLTNSQNVSLAIRLLMSGKEVGSIIGKKGENVKKYREESGAKINISDGSSPERIVTITGTVEQIFIAFAMMSQKFEDDFTQGLLRMGDDGLSCPPVTLRLLVPATQCGSIIGKGGCRIKDVRELTGASIQVASEALPLSTERTVTISGTAKAIAKCIKHLCEVFMESPVKGPVIPYRPKPAYPNQTVICPAGPLSSRILQSGLALSSAGSEAGPEYNSTTNGCLSGLVLSSGALQQAAESLTTTTVSSIPHSLVGALTAGSECGFGTSADSLSPGAPMATCRTPATVTELLADSGQMSQNPAYPDFPAYPLPMLCTLNLTQLNSGLIPGTVLNTTPTSTFVIPDLTFNPGLLYTQQQPVATGLAPPNHFVYTGFPNLLKSVSSCAKQNYVLGPNQAETNLDSAETQSSYSSTADLFSNSSMVSLFPNSSLSHFFGSAMAPFVQNKASLLGLPNLAAPVHPGGTYSTLPSPDEQVVKELVISNELIGCIIGRGGTTVNEIRNLSKAQIKISNCEDGSKERKITLSGSLQAVNMANFLINNRVSAEIFAGMVAFINQ